MTLSTAAPAYDWDAAARVHGRRVVVSLLALGLPLDRAEDVAQRAWLRLVEQHRAGALRDVRLPGLAIAQARFLALDEAKRARPADDVDDRFASADPDPERRDVAKERLERALAALATASPTARRVFRLCYDDPPRPHAEVAAEVGLSLQRVRQILCETRAVMRRALDDDEQEPA